jgi:hypothetical protein
VADFRREYGITPDELAAMGLPDFHMYVRGLSRHSTFLQAWSNAPKHLYDPADVAAVTAAARR